MIRTIPPYIDLYVVRDEDAKYFGPLWDHEDDAFEYMEENSVEGTVTRLTYQLSHRTNVDLSVKYDALSEMYEDQAYAYSRRDDEPFGRFIINIDEG